jgi:hypothetical protein
MFSLPAVSFSAKHRATGPHFFSDPDISSALFTDV